jgi:AcrR family transcriptional regulator
MAAPSPSDERQLRPQGRETRARLLESGLQVLAERGYHATRVDDVVRSAEVSHGTFYLYFASKEELFGALARDAAEEVGTLIAGLDPVQDGDSGRRALRAWLGDFLDAYRRHGPVIRVWMENQSGDGDLRRLANQTFAEAVGSLESRVSAGGDDSDAAVRAVALLAMIERFAYFVVSRRLEVDEERLLDTLSLVVQRGFFAPPASGS